MAGVIVIVAVAPAKVFVVGWPVTTVCAVVVTAVTTTVGVILEAVTLVKVKSSPLTLAFTAVIEFTLLVDTLDTTFLLAVGNVISKSPEGVYEIVTVST